MRLELAAYISSNRKPNGFRTFYAHVRLFRRFWIQRWDVTGRPSWTCGVAK